MVAFVYTDKREEVMNWSYDARRRVIIDEMVDRFGIEATHPLLYEETYWTEDKNLDSWVLRSLLAAQCDD